MIDQNMYRSRNNSRSFSICRSQDWQLDTLGSASSVRMRQYHGKPYLFKISSTINLMLWIQAISDICYISSPPIPSTPHMFNCQQRTIQSPPRFTIIPNSGRTSRTHLVHWTAVTYTARPPQTNAFPIEIAKASSLRTAFSHAHLAFNLCLPILGGRGLQLMHKYIRVLFYTGGISQCMHWLHGEHMTAICKLLLQYLQ